MKSLPIKFKSGVPVYEQVLYAARKAIITGELKTGDIFPSVRDLSAQYQINPNTVQKALVVLRNEGLIESIPGIGNRVALAPEGNSRASTELLEQDLEAIVLRAKQLNLTQQQVLTALQQHWKNL